MRRHPSAILILTGLLFLVAVPASLFAGDMERSVTIYTRDLASISEVRTIDLGQGYFRYDFENLLPGLVDGSATVEVLSGSDIAIQSLQFKNNLLDLDKYWASRIGEMVTVELDDSTDTEGALRRVTGSHLFVETDEGLKVVSRSAMEKDLVINPLPAELVTEPTLSMFYTAKKGGERKVRLTYLTTGLTWEGVHRAELGRGAPTVTPGFVVRNSSGKSLDYTTLDLVAGEIHLAGDKRKVDRMNPKPGALKGSDKGKTGDLRHWNIDTPGSLAVGKTTLQPMGAMAGIDPERFYLYDATIFDDRVAAKLSFSLDTPLPGGKVRVYETQGGMPLLTGEDRIDDTPSGSPLELTLGQVFDITAERTRLKEGASDDGGTSQTFRVTLGNSGKNAVTVRILERLFGDWAITKATANGEEISTTEEDARTARFDILVAAGSTVQVDYEIHYAR